MPFSLVLEALAQTSGALIADLTEGSAGAIAYFMGADHVRQRRTWRPLAHCRAHAKSRRSS
jgi:3-hydroxymyristoyl/3-hydroxydecanoyl-(acyl carrier protein) dehydratase